jgi:anti-sigma factor RsiW
MNCDQARILLHPYLDGELEVARCLEIVEHLRGCPGCDSSRAQIQRLSKLLAQPELRLTAPAALKERVQGTLAISERPADFTRKQRRVALAAVAAAALLGVIAFGIGRSIWQDRSSQELLAGEVTAAHFRSLQADHLVDVKSSDRHTVKPFFSGKLDFSAPVVDMSGRGFELLGGRLDVLEIHPVAASVYRRRKHVINVFVWPSAERTQSAISESTRRGYTLLNWTGGGRVVWIISDLNPNELREFATGFRQSLDETAAG